MAFPFDILDLFIPEIGHWMAGKSTSEKRRLRNSGVGLTFIGFLIAGIQYLYPDIGDWIFFNHAWAYFIAFMFLGSGLGLLACLLLDNKINNVFCGECAIN